MEKRTIQLKEGTHKKGPVVYWMSRDQRIHDNWALLSAIQKAAEIKMPVVIVFNLVRNFLVAGSRQYRFMLKGLKEVYNTASEYNIPFYLLRGEPGITVPEFIKDISASVLFTDFDPLKIKRKWLSDVVGKIEIPAYQTDAHNIVPAFIVSAKQEFAAMHFRRKITPLLTEYMDEYPEIRKQESNDLISTVPEFDSIILDYDEPPYEVDWIKPGPDRAFEVLEEFLNNRLDRYAHKNDPNSKAVSDLSPYLHLGNISAQRIVLNIEKAVLDPGAKASFLDELVVRRELSDNFCFYNNKYDNFDGFPAWGKETLNKHRKDEREFIYNSSEFEKAETHDPLWNAAQNEMVRKGKMHGYMRMY
jgi:deoxyribodipyrimidine photo-lyase